jgi:CBS domain-containing protein
MQFFDGIMEDISDALVREEASRKLLSELQSTVLFFNQHLENIQAAGGTNQTDLLTIWKCSPSVLLREINSARSPDEIIRLNAIQPYIIATFIESGAKPQSINSLTTLINDAIRKKFIECAIEQLGTPPAAFAFMVFGSEGREEQTLHTDQDNAIVYEDISPERENSVREYFLALGKVVCTWLNDAGYVFCKGNNMAMNPELCQPTSVWTKYFGTWVFSATGEDLLRTKIFFDFRCAFGDESLVNGLKGHLNRVVSENFRFLQILARDILNMEPPIGRFGKFIVERSGGNRGGLDIKKAMVPIVDFARIYALKHEINTANTIKRLNALRELKILTDLSHKEMVQAYSFLMQMRLNVQADAVSSGSKQPDNIVFPKKLTSIEQHLLKEIFTQTKNYQTRLSYDFTGQPGDV